MLKDASSYEIIGFLDAADQHGQDIPTQIGPQVCTYCSYASVIHSMRWKGTYRISIKNCYEPARYLQAYFIDRCVRFALRRLRRSHVQDSNLLFGDPVNQYTMKKETPYSEWYTNVQVDQCWLLHLLPIFALLQVDVGGKSTPKRNRTVSCEARLLKKIFLKLRD